MLDELESIASDHGPFGAGVAAGDHHDPLLGASDDAASHHDSPLENSKNASSTNQKKKQQEQQLRPSHVNHIVRGGLRFKGTPVADNVKQKTRQARDRSTASVVQLHEFGDDLAKIVE